MPRSNSSRGVADGGKRGKRRACTGTSLRWRRAVLARRRGIREVERLPGPAPARRFAGGRRLASAERTRRAGSIRILIGIERIATAAALRRRRCPLLLHDRAWSCDLRIVARLLGLRLPIGRIGINRGQCWHARLSGDNSLTAGCVGRRTLQPLQAILELPVAVFQFLILTGEPPQLIFQLLDPHFRIAVIGLRHSMRCGSEHRRHRGRLCKLWEFR